MENRNANLRSCESLTLHDLLSLTISFSLWAVSPNNKIEDRLIESFVRRSGRGLI
jgi:hypothetical protein